MHVKKEKKKKINDRLRTITIYSYNRLLHRKGMISYRISHEHPQKKAFYEPGVRLCAPLYSFPISNNTLLLGYFGSSHTATGIKGSGGGEGN